MNTSHFPQLLLTFYGDDFTGSTDAMEALTLRGLPAVLFLRPPSADDLARFPQARAAGVAGISRGQSPSWMDEHLPPVFASLRELGAPLCHYKVCSTFDSSPTHGSIGRAAEIGRAAFGSACVPFIVGAPILRRYMIFGNLYATANGTTYRLDRHPTMSRHPVTPMHESDLRLHFALQSRLAPALVDILDVQAGRGLERYEELRRDGAAAIFFDVLDALSLREIGRTLWDSKADSPLFVVGSSGVEYALLEYWSSLDLLPPEPPEIEATAEDRLLVVSGSCSPTTGGQIEWALANGFSGIRVDPIALVTGSAEYERAMALALQALLQGGSPLIYSAAGPRDTVSARDEDFGRRVGERLGCLARDLVRRSGVRRSAIAGGDTSGHAGLALGIHALTVIRRCAPGGPLCRIWSGDASIDGGEIVLKGGQVGGPEFFGVVKRGKPITGS